MTERIHYQMIISCPEMDYEAAKKLLAPILSERFAGATFNAVDGAWSQQGDQFKHQYTEIEFEHGIRIDCTTLPDENTVEIFQYAAQALKNVTGWDIKWVHLESWPVSAGHFSI